MARRAGQLVNVARHHLLRCRTHRDQHVGVVRGDLLDQAMHGAHGAGGAARTEAMRTRLRGVTFADVVRLIENGRQPGV